MISVVREYKTVAIKTGYWRPGEDLLQKIADSIRNQIRDGDVLTISEKAISTALGNLVDESTLEPSRTAYLLAKYWMRIVWGYILGPVARLRNRTIMHLRNYPLKQGSRHKQLALEQTGFFEVLMFGSEGGIDASNLPYSYVSLPLRNAPEIAQQIHAYIKTELGKNVVVMILDTDKTYSLGAFHFTPRPAPIQGIYSFGGFLSHVIGRFLKMQHRATPLGIAGSRIETEEALEIAELTNRARGFGAGKTVWDMAERFSVPITEVTWEMLDQLEHKPLVIAKLFPAGRR